MKRIKFLNSPFALSVVLAIFAIGTGKAYGVARVLEFDFTVNDTDTYTYALDSDWEIQEMSESGSKDIDCDLEYTITEDNGNNSFDIVIDQTDGTITIDGGSPVSMSNGSDTTIVQEGRGKVLHQLDPALLFPDLDENYNFGSVDNDTTGPFISTAVDVNDTWTQTVQVTPYNQSSQNININCKLEEWTTLNGHNVGKIKRTWTRPISAVDKSNSNKTLSGNLSCTDYWWYSYDEKVLVKSQLTTSGTLTYTTGGSPPYDECDMDVSQTVVTTLN